MFCLYSLLRFRLVFVVVFMLQVFHFNTYSQQNLVPNGSFEEYTFCPYGNYEIDKVVGWSNAGGSPDYFNSCALTGGASVPSNFYGFQNASTGNAYIGIYTYNREVNYPFNREHVQTTLTSHLEIGRDYHVSFDISFTLDNNEVGFGSNKLGFLFTNISSYTGNSPPPLNNNAQVFIDTIITDTMIWYNYKGIFTADSAYQNLIIGNFFDDSNTEIIGIDNSLYIAYYYIDNICVSSDSLDCISTMNNTEQAKIDFEIYPNPTIKGDIWLKIPEAFWSSVIKYKINNSLGQTVLSQSFQSNSNKYKIDLNHLENGVYYLNIENSLLPTRKIIINNQ